MAKSIFRIILASLIAIIFDARAQSQPDATPETTATPAPQAKDVYSLRFYTEGWKTQIVVNGVPVFDRDKGSGRFPIENLVVNGPNKIDVRATQTEPNAQEMEVVLLVSDIATGETNTLSRATGRPVKAGNVVEETIDFQGVVPMQWEWLKGAELHVLTPADKDEIYAQVKKLADSLNAKDLKTHNELRAVYLDEAAQCEGMDRAKVESLSDEMYNKLFTGEISPWRVRGRDEVTIEPYGKITVLSAKQRWPDNWTLALKLSDTQDFTFADFLFSKIGGKWVLIN